MRRVNECVSVTAVLILFCASVSATPSPYAGQQDREIKALSTDEIQGYLNGNGMGFAKAAELNHYPGPRHVLDLSEKLALSDDQLRQTRLLYNDMKQRAITLGKELVDKEMQLEKLFSKGDVNSENLQQALKDLGEIRAKLRYVHLNAHLEQKRILTRHQAVMYDRLRGYAGGQHGHNHDH